MNKMNDLPQFCEASGVDAKVKTEFNRPGAGSVFCAICLPPPLHGQSLISASVVHAALMFADQCDVEVADISPGRNAIGFRYHLTRAYRTAQAVVRLVKRGRRPNQQLYTVFESGFGVGYNIIIVGLARMLGYNIVLHHHTSKHTFERQYRFSILQKIAGRSCINVVLSDQMAKNLRRIYPSVGKILVSQNACHIPDGEMRTEPRAAPSKLRVGFLGNLCLEKGLDVALQTAEICRKRGLDLTFVFAGPAVGPEAKQLLAGGRELLGEYIEVSGPVTGESKADFFKSIDVFLFPTRYRFEAQPLVLLEAMSYGLPVITTHCGYIAELVGAHGIVLEDGEKLPESIAEQLQKMIFKREYSRWKSLETKSYFMDLRATATGQLQELMGALFHGKPEDFVSSKRQSPDYLRGSAHDRRNDDFRHPAAL